jgi:hypothetical protein
VGEILARTVRSEWPFLTRLHALISDLSTSLRPALLVLLGSRFGDPDRREQVSLAAPLLAHAVELACSGRMRELRAGHRETPPTSAERLEICARTGPALLFATAGELGARVAGATAETTAALGDPAAAPRGHFGETKSRVEPL